MENIGKKEKAFVLALAAFLIISMATTGGIYYTMDKKIDKTEEKAANYEDEIRKLRKEASEISAQAVNPTPTPTKINSFKAGTPEKFVYDFYYSYLDIAKEREKATAFDENKYLTEDFKKFIAEEDAKMVASGGGFNLLTWAQNTPDEGIDAWTIHETDSSAKILLRMTFGGSGNHDILVDVKKINNEWKIDRTYSLEKE